MFVLSSKSTVFPSLIYLSLHVQQLVCVCVCAMQKGNKMHDCHYARSSFCDTNWNEWLAVSSITSFFHGIGSNFWQVSSS